MFGVAGGGGEVRGARWGDGRVGGEDHITHFFFTTSIAFFCMEVW